MLIRARIFLIALIATGFWRQATFAATNEDATPILWRQTTPGSSTTEAMFKYRSPQFILYRHGLIVYRDDDLTMPYRQVRFSPKAYRLFLRGLEATYHLSGLTPERLAREEPYIKSVQKPILTKTAGTVTIWIGVRNPPSLIRRNTAVLEARDGNTQLGPAWEALNRLNRYLAAFHPTRAIPHVPSRVEIAVQPLPSYLEDSAASAAAWPLPDVVLRDVRGERLRGYRTLSGEAARTAYAFLNEHAVVREKDAVYLVWVRPILRP